MRESLARMALGFASILGMLGVVITFVPGAEANWFGMVAIIAAGGLLSRELKTRVASAIVVLFGITIAIGGYWRGVEYRERAQQAKANKQE